MLPSLNGLWAQAVPNPPVGSLKAEFVGIETLADQTSDGLKGIAIRTDVRFLEGGNSLSEDLNIYTIFCKLYDQQGFPIQASTGATRYTGLGGQCQDSILAIHGHLRASTDPQVLFIPYYGIGLEHGQRTVIARLSLRDQRDGNIVVESAPFEIRFFKPYHRLVRMKVNQLEVSEINDKGESWDFKFLSPKEMLPELRWALRRGQSLIFQSDKQKNTLLYDGNSADLTPWFLISEGDKLTFQVFDFDLLGFSDVIGNFEIDLGNGRYANGVTNDLPFGQVKSAKFVVDVLLPPKVNITKYEVVEGERFDGVTGSTIRLDYSTENRIRNATIFLSLTRLTDQARGIPSHVRILSGNATPTYNGRVELNGSQSHLELFVPHYAFSKLSERAAHALMEVAVTVKFDNQLFDFDRQTRQMVALDLPIEDVDFGQWKLNLLDRVGGGGIRFALEYNVPDAYFKEMPFASFFIVPAIKAEWGWVNNQDWIPLGLENHAWHDSLLSVENRNRKGNLELYLPYHRCKPAKGNVSFAANYRAVMVTGSDTLTIGTLSRNMEAELPELRELRIAVKEVLARREHWMVSDPNLYWVLKSGEDEVFRSPIILSQKNPKWPERLEASIVAAPKDKIVLVVMHHGNPGEDRSLETWRVNAENVPNKPKGNSRLRPESLKKLAIHSYWVE